MIVWEKTQKDKSTLAKITELNRMSTDELKKLWGKLYNPPSASEHLANNAENMPAAVRRPPEFKRQLLLRRLAYKIQEIAHGGVDVQTNARMTILLDQSGYDEMGRRKPDPNELPYKTPGTVFVREWHDKKHEVTLLDNGKFEYDGIPYKSLTAIATKITGTKRNGPKFFGLRDKGKQR